MGGLSATERQTGQLDTGEGCGEGGGAITVQRSVQSLRGRQVGRSRVRAPVNLSAKCVCTRVCMHMGVCVSQRAL